MVLSSLIEPVPSHREPEPQQGAHMVLSSLIEPAPSHREPEQELGAYMLFMSIKIQLRATKSLSQSSEYIKCARAVSMQGSEFDISATEDSQKDCNTIYDTANCLTKESDIVHLNTFVAQSVNAMTSTRIHMHLVQRCIL